MWRVRRCASRKILTRRKARRRIQLSTTAFPWLRSGTTIHQSPHQPTMWYPGRAPALRCRTLGASPDRSIWCARSRQDSRRPTASGMCRWSLASGSTSRITANLRRPTTVVKGKKKPAGFGGGLLRLSGLSGWILKFSNFQISRIPPNSPLSLSTLSLNREERKSQRQRKKKTKRKSREGLVRLFPPPPQFVWCNL